MALRRQGSVVGEHLVGVGADAKTRGRHATREDGQQKSGKHDKQSVAAAGVDQAGKQAIQHRGTATRDREASDSRLVSPGPPLGNRRSQDAVGGG